MEPMLPWDGELSHLGINAAHLNVAPNLITAIPGASYGSCGRRRYSWLWTRLSKNGMLLKNHGLLQFCSHLTSLDPSAASWLRSRVLFWCQDRVVFRFDSTAEGPGHRNNVRKRPFGNQRSLVFCLVGFFQLPGSVATTVYLGVLWGFGLPWTPYVSLVLWALLRPRGRRPRWPSCLSPAGAGAAVRWTARVWGCPGERRSGPAVGGGPLGLGLGLRSCVPPGGLHFPACRAPPCPGRPEAAARRAGRRQLHPPSCAGSGG